MKTTARTLALFLATPFLVAVATSAEPNSIAIAGASGRLFGTLQESASRTELLLVRPGGEAILVGQCADETVQDLPSPNPSIRARVSYRNCGATVDFATHVLLVGDDERVGVAVFRGRQKVELAWVGSSLLSLRTPALADDDTFLKRLSAENISFTYVETQEPSAAESPYLDFSSFNFGATGRAAGMPPELLLRIAGWSQQASGMNREGWGTWSGPPPYGDDPRGSHKVADGIRYFESKQVQ